MSQVPLTLVISTAYRTFAGSAVVPGRNTVAMDASVTPVIVGQSPDRSAWQAASARSAATAAMSDVGAVFIEKRSKMDNSGRRALAAFLCLTFVASWADS